MPAEWGLVRDGPRDLPEDGAEGGHHGHRPKIEEIAVLARFESGGSE
jgi:hypothetical protein